VVVLAASVDDSTTRKYISQFAHTYKMEFPIFVDASFDTMREAGLGDAIPSTVLLTIKSVSSREEFIRRPWR